MFQLDASGIRKWSRAKQVSREAAKLWLTGLLFNAVAGFYTLFHLRQRSQALDKKEGEAAVESKKIER